MNQNDSVKEGQNETKQKAELEDLPIDESRQDEVKGGGGMMSVLNTS